MIMAHLTEPEFTSDWEGYPTERTLQTIREWPVFETGLQPLLEFVRKAWKYENLATETNGLWIFSTGGWSGNEELCDVLVLVPWCGLALRYAEFGSGYYVIATSKAAADAFDAALEAYNSVLQRYLNVYCFSPYSSNCPDRAGGTKGGA